jgi:hypothetical protein
MFSACALKILRESVFGLFLVRIRVSPMVFRPLVSSPCVSDFNSVKSFGKMRQGLRGSVNLFHHRLRHTLLRNPDVGFYLDLQKSPRLFGRFQLAQKLRETHGSTRNRKTATYLKLLVCFFRDSSYFRRYKSLSCFIPKSISEKLIRYQNMTYPNNVRIFV